MSNGAAMFIAPVGSPTFRPLVPPFKVAFSNYRQFPLVPPAKVPYQIFLKFRQFPQRNYLLPNDITIIDLLQKRSI